MMAIKKTVLFDIDGILNKISIEERQRAAELGCGNFGFFTFPLARLVGRNGRVYAVDILKSSLVEIKTRALKENLPQIIPVWSNLEVYKGTAIEAGSLDAALLINVLHQSDRRADILRETYRMLKNNGRLLIVDWNNIDSPLGPAPARRLKLEALKAAVSRLGFDIKEEFLAGVYHYGLLLTKL